MIHESFERANMITIMPVPKSKYCIKLRGLKQKCKNKKKKRKKLTHNGKLELFLFVIT